MVDSFSKGGATMTQLHKRFTDEQIRLLFKRYCEGLMPRFEIEEIIDVIKPIEPKTI